MDILEIIKVNYPILGYQKTANLLGISVYRLKNIIKRDKLILERKRNVSIDNFNKITKKEVAYFLGFLWADGCVVRDEIQILIKESDGEEIYKVLSSFGKWNIKNKIAKLNGKEYKQTLISINDKYIREFL